jgi:hypothetical protein
VRPVEHRSQNAVSRELSRLSGTEERGFSPFDVHMFDEDRTRFGLKLQLLLGLPFERGCYVEIHKVAAKGTAGDLSRRDIDDGEGKPSRWNTLRALRVLNWANDGR